MAQGYEVCVPALPTLSEANAHAFLMASWRGTSFDRKAARLPKKQSPAPLVSTTDVAGGEGIKIPPSSSKAAVRSKAPCAPKVTKMVVSSLPAVYVFVCRYMSD